MKMGWAKPPYYGPALTDDSDKCPKCGSEHHEVYAGMGDVHFVCIECEHEWRGHEEKVKGGGA